jgi:TonB family protein
LKKAVQILISLVFALAVNVFIFGVLGIWVFASERVTPSQKKAHTSADIFVQSGNRPKKKIQTQKQIKNLQQPVVIGLPDIPSSFSVPSFESADPADTMPVVHLENTVSLDGLVKDDMILTEDVLDESPRPLVKTAPMYPAALERQGIEGEVEARLLLEKDGSVSRVDIVTSSPPGLFDEAAKRALFSWKFAPATYQGKSLKAWVTQRVVFKLH